MRRLIAAAVVGGLAMVAPGAATAQDAKPDADLKKAVIGTYADIAHAGYEDSLILAKRLLERINALIETPGEATMRAARQAWIAARVPYMQTEVYRFGNAIVDDWEGKVNAWPLDEGLIDYVDAAYGKSSKENPFYAANVIANPSIKLGGRTVDASKITKALISETLHEAGKVEANVGTGYHAVEFLLWGQDLNGTGPGAGNRPWTDFSRDECTHGNCERRAAYLRVAAELLVDDLAWMTKQWALGGAARKGLMDGDPDAGISAIVTGLGSLSYGELAGERMKLGLLLHDPEEEHDCFADNTHNSHFYDVVGMLNVYTGTYTRIDGRKVVGPSLGDLIAVANPALNSEMLARLAATEAAMGAIKARAEEGEAYDQMIAKGNEKGNATVQGAIDALTTQTRSIEKIVSALGLKRIDFEGSDSLDNPEQVFK